MGWNKNRNNKIMEKYRIITKNTTFSFPFVTGAIHSFFKKHMDFSVKAFAKHINVLMKKTTKAFMCLKSMLVQRLVPVLELPKARQSFLCFIIFFLLRHVCLFLNIKSFMCWISYVPIKMSGWLLGIKLVRYKVFSRAIF